MTSVSTVSRSFRARDHWPLLLRQPSLYFCCSRADFTAAVNASRDAARRTLKVVIRLHSSMLQILAVDTDEWSPVPLRL